MTHREGCMDGRCGHTSDCAVHNEPVMSAGECDCDHADDSVFEYENWWWFEEYDVEYARGPYPTEETARDMKSAMTAERVKRQEPTEGKYQTYADLAVAYASGELNASTPLTMDNDSCHVYVDDVCVFHGNGQIDAVEMMRALGIPCEPA